MASIPEYALIDKIGRAPSPCGYFWVSTVKVNRREKGLQTAVPSRPVRGDEAFARLRLQRLSVAMPSLFTQIVGETYNITISYGLPNGNEYVILSGY